MAHVGLKKGRKEHKESIEREMREAKEITSQIKE